MQAGYYIGVSLSKYMYECATAIITGLLVLISLFLFFVTLHTWGSTHLSINFCTIQGDGCAKETTDAHISKMLLKITKLLWHYWEWAFVVHAWAGSELGTIYPWILKGVSTGKSAVNYTMRSTVCFRNLDPTPLQMKSILLVLLWQTIFPGCVEIIGMAYARTWVVWESN